jgi:hypothetical protein
MTGTPTMPLTPDQLAALVDLSKRARKVRRAEGVARFGGWTGAIFAAITLASSAMSWSPSGLFVGAGLAVVAAGEFYGAALLSRMDPRGPRRLALNQVLLAAVLVAYGAWCLALGPNDMTTGDPGMDSWLRGVAWTIHGAVYGTVMAVGVVAPGLTAWYYASRAKQIAELRRTTEPSLIAALTQAA